MLGLGATALLPVCAHAQSYLLPSLDPTVNGPYQVAESEYHLPAGVDRLVDSTVVTELWAEIYRPVDDGHTAHPLLVFLHGNHTTCGHYVHGTLGRVDDNSQYTTTGTCPAWRWCTDRWGGRRLLVGLDGLDALQIRRVATPPHPEGPSSDHQLGHL